MNLSHATILLTLVAAGLAAVAGGQPTAGPGGFSELQRARVADTDGLEVVMGIVKRPAESISAKHYHPGGEFGFFLYSRDGHDYSEPAGVHHGRHYNPALHRASFALPSWWQSALGFA